MKKFTWFDAAALVVWLLPVAYLFFIYPTLPAKVPLHFGPGGKPDAFGEPKDLFGFQYLLLGVSLGVYLLIKYLPQIDPKQKAKYSADTFQKMSLGMVLFLSAINLAVLFATANGSFNIDKLLYPLMGLFFAFLGNLMNSIKPNYFAGIRTPWTLESEDTWRATHRLAAKLWFWGGVLITIITLLIKGQAASTFFLCGTIMLALIPMVYSFIYFKKHQLKAE
ncbi:SdpI family protein [Mucilaginibacter galii]|uniref:Immunity protein SdpI n=1 Tax=Mucilaginibacter galii TaxID=2005073 RepID=A0A917J832_9SPHI|nr:SdpI family protein [Mucilaginibacter galii]GGI50379.1 immunity protein SdpI [Mucilaginibacter galii]